MKIRTLENDLKQQCKRHNLDISEMMIVICFRLMKVIYHLCLHIHKELHLNNNNNILPLYSNNYCIIIVVTITLLV